MFYFYILTPKDNNPYFVCVVVIKIVAEMNYIGIDEW